MKKWYEPKIYELGLKMTMSNSNGDKIKIHYCHETKSYSCIGHESDHNASGKEEHTFTGIACEAIHIKEGNEDCCCIGIS